MIPGQLSSSKNYDFFYCRCPIIRYQLQNKDGIMQSRLSAAVRPWELMDYAGRQWSKSIAARLAQI